jgi:formylglycine-generating enzyme required for sulfatase activity
VTLLAGAKAARGSAFAVWALVEALCYREPEAAESDVADMWGGYLAGQALAETADLGRVSERDQGKVQRVRRWLVQILQGATQPAVERAGAGDTLARLGDPRFNADAWYLPVEPLLGFTEIPAGSFQMGSNPERDTQSSYDEQPQHEVRLPTYYIARHPVTVAQFRAFAEESSYQARGPWKRYSSLDNHPVVVVTWNDARAYCEWLTEQLWAWEGTPEPLASLLHDEGWQVRMPTEAEWEKAARGEDGRTYPWGKEADPNRANYNDTGIGTTSAVGCFPGGASPHGIEDMSGNVWEWCHSLRRDYPYDPNDGREDPKGADYRVLRGGAFSDNERHVRCASRVMDGPDLGYWYNGFRIVVAPGF